MAKTTVLLRLVSNLAEVTSQHRTIRHILIGNPANRRVTMFQEALQKYRLELADVISYSDLLTGRRSLEDALCRMIPTRQSERQLTCLRIESPGEDFEVEKLLIARGADSDDIAPCASRISKPAALRLSLDHGRVRFPAQWFAGFRRLLSEISATVAVHPHIKLYNVPTDIICLFNKPECHRYLAAATIPVAPALYAVSSLDDLRERMTNLGWSRVFVKLASGSSASGVIALFIRGKEMRAVTSMEIVGNGARTKFYNNLNLRTYHRTHEIRRAVDFLCREGAHVEQWLPKATVGARPFDLRLLVIAGKAQHVVMRTSSSPITNLHLGNRRGDVNQLRQRMAGEQWQMLIHVAESAAKSFSGSLTIGFDILLKPGLREPTILEANAFGDLLPGIEHQGLNSYEAQITAQLQSPLRGKRCPNCQK